MTRRTARREATTACALAALLAAAAACAGGGAATRGRPVVATGLRAERLDTTLTRRVTLRYLLHLPRDYDAASGRRWPLVLYLHGGSLRGDDPDTVRTWGVPARAARDPAFPFIVIAPQAARGTLWTDTEALVALLDAVQAHHAVDADRVYLTGHSMGGNGTWYLAWAHPERFAAIAPMSAPANPWWATRLRGTPTWVFHGARDSVVPVAESEAMVRALQAAGSTTVRFTRLDGREHGILDVYEGEELYAWLLRQRRE